jgi:hypothetical protein
MKLAVATARRGRAAVDDVVNARPPERPLMTFDRE